MSGSGDIPWRRTRNLLVVAPCLLGGRRRGAQYRGVRGEPVMPLFG